MPDDAELAARLDRFVATEDPAIMLDDRTVALAAGLLRSAYEDIRVAHVLGWTCWSTRSIRTG